MGKGEGRFSCLLVVITRHLLLAPWVVFYAFLVQATAKDIFSPVHLSLDTDPRSVASPK